MGLLEKIAYGVSFSIMIALLFLMIYSENGVLDWLALKREAGHIEMQNQKLADENRDRGGKIERLKQDMVYIEHIARHELGMVREDELVFRFTEKPVQRRPGEEKSNEQQDDHL